MGEVRAVWEHGGIRVDGSALAPLLAVVPAGALDIGPELVPMAGRWRSDGGGAHFTPRFPAPAGAAYVVVGRADDRQHWIEQARVHVTDASPEPTAVVERIDPGGGEVPANLLRFSVTFSRAMEEGSAGGRIHLLDAGGAELPGTLLPTPPELWDRERRRLTVLLEPGRIKRGLRPNVEAGAPLSRGQRVTLVVDAGVRDVTGAPLRHGARSTFRVTAPVRSRVDPARWTVEWPDASGGGLAVRFDRPLDAALARQCLTVLDEGGHPVAGTATLDPDASAWTFAPADRRAPAAALAALRVDSRLEDLAGNSVRRVFDRDLSNPADARNDTPAVLLRRDATSTGT